MKTPAPADLQRWSEDVARDATSLSFLPLARAYRRQGRRDAALRLCLRGLEHHPDNVDGHSLLAMLYFESGQRVKAYDEWSMVLTLEPDNFDALRGMGFYYLEQEDHTAAKRHLERAAFQKAHDPAVQEGLRIIRERLGENAPQPQAAPDPMDFSDEPWADTPSTTAAPSTPSAPPASTASTAGSGWGAGAGGTASVAVQPEPARPIAPLPPAPAPKPEPAHAAPRPGPAPAPKPEPAPAAPRPGPAPVPKPEPADPAPPPALAPVAAAQSFDDPSRIFDSLLKGGQVLGALILDSQGLVMGGSLSGAVGSQAETLGGILGGAIEEALRTTQYLGLGEWKGVLLEADAAVLHFAPVSEGMIVLLAAQKNAPTGWVLRSAGQANTIARQFLEAYS